MVDRIKELIKYKGFQVSSNSSNLTWYHNIELISNKEEERSMSLIFNFQVAPAELEAILLTHPSVEDAAVVP